MITLQNHSNSDSEKPYIFLYHSYFTDGEAIRKAEYLLKLLKDVTGVIQNQDIIGRLWQIT